MLKGVVVVFVCVRVVVLIANGSFFQRYFVPSGIYTVLLLQRSGWFPEPMGKLGSKSLPVVSLVVVLCSASVL